MTKQAQQRRPAPPAQAQDRPVEPPVQEEVIKNLPVAMDFEGDAGKGVEGADRDSYAIPFLVVLQPMSPQLDVVQGAKAGQLLNSVTNDLYTTPIIVPCAFQRRWVRWGAREAGGGFKGELVTAQVNELRASGQLKELDGRLYFPESDGSVNPKKSDRVADTRSHFCLVLRSEEDEIGVPMVFALTSTGIKVSKNLMSRIDGIKMRGAQGLFTPPSFSHAYAVKTTLKTNEKGKWWQPDCEIVGPVRSQALYAMAKAFHAQVIAGRVEVAHDSVREPMGGGAGDHDDRM